MLKAAALGLGIFLAILGLAGHAVESYKPRGKAKAESYNMLAYEQPVPHEPWKPWAIMAAGAVIIIWTFTLPQKMSGK